MDLSVFTFINGFAGNSELIDQTIDHIAFNNLFKGTIPVLVFWFLWASKREDIAARRIRLMAILPTAIIAIFVGRMLALQLPFRVRPVHNPEVPFSTPAGKFVPALSDWSSFPSDHAVMFFSIAVAFLWVSRPAAILLILHAIFVISFPRVYLGLHWPSDILAGAAVGVLLAWVLMPTLIRFFHWIRIERLLHYEQFMLPLLVLITMEIANMFSTARFFLNAVAKALSLT